MPLRSAIYEGWVRHRRYAPRPHAFRYALSMMYLDLDELPALFRGHVLWGLERPAVGSFHREDYLGDPRRPLEDAVADVVEDRLGRRPDGPIRLLTHLRYFGYAFNPIRAYYCFDGEAVDAIVLEVTNTPWGQRHCYVLDAASAAPGGTLRCAQPKAMHVSPFLAMNVDYRFAIPMPGERLALHVDCLRGGEKTLDATLWMSRRPWNRSNLTRTLFRHPWLTGKVIGAIYWQALRLWWKGIPYVPPPNENHRDEDPLDPGATPKSLVSASALVGANLGPRLSVEATREAP